MDLRNISEVVAALRQRLESVERSERLLAVLGGQSPNARNAAVLLPLFAYEGEAALAFIRRSETLRSHSGQIAFPGGGSEALDSSLVETALREAQEEIGLAPERSDVLGLLAPLFTSVSNYVITPVVAFLPEGPGPLQLQASEVTEVIIATLHGLADPAIFHTEEWTRAGASHTVYFYDYGPYRIWGATAYILNMLLSLLER